MNRRPKPPRAKVKATIPRVAVLVDTSTTWGRRVISGIYNYTRLHGVWQIFVEARGMEEHLNVPANWPIKGVIARVGTEKMADQLSSVGVPVVNVSAVKLPGVTFPLVANDTHVCASMALEHFLDRGFHNFAYFGLRGLPYVENQQVAFMRSVEAAGHSCAQFDIRTHAGAEPDWSFDLRKLGIWLLGLPKPVAVFTWNASSAREILFGCQAAGLRVPEEVAVLSGADDDLLCEVSPVPISAIKVAAEQIGFQAAALLDRCMSSRSKPKRDIRIPPIAVVTRQSTDTLAITDNALVAALSFIRERAAQPVQVEEVASHVGVSRRALERRFASVLERTPADEIRRQHLELAKKLLAETDMAIPDVSDAAGFSSPEYMAFVFRRELDQNPRSYRQNNKIHR